jgi:Cof subfamily protein (haloacid dehalogenase superfamily)
MFSPASPSEGNNGNEDTNISSFDNEIADFSTYGGPGAPNKLDVYEEDDLANLLQLHQQLYPITSKNKSDMGGGLPGPFDESPNSAFSGIHDLVMDTVKELEVEKVQEPLPVALTTADAPPPTWLSLEIQEKMKNIQAIASDVDGTITGSDQSVHPKTVDAIQRAVEASYSPIHRLKWFFPATGKSKAGALNSLPPQIASLLEQGPGVYIQGVYCVYGDKVIFEKKLPTLAVHAVEQLVAESRTSIIAYDGDTLLTNDLTDTVKELHAIYREPLSREISSIAEYGNGVHKVLVCDNDLEKLGKVRQQLEDLAKEYDCVVTQAVPTMLELLPSGCSKAIGVQKLCHELGIDPETQLLAVGDAENDVGMLEMAAIGCAVENANNLAKDAADLTVPLSSTDGGAGLAFEILGGV